MVIGAGARDELPREFGSAHFAEHALFKGTACRRAWHINSRLERLGGELNAFTTKEDTTVHATTLRGDFAKAVELIADVVCHSTFPDREIEREREVILDEINSYRDNPAELIYDEFEELLFKGTPLGHNILGTPTSIKNIDSSVIQKFVSRNYTPDRMVFSSVGNMSVGQVERMVARYFGDFRAASVEIALRDDGGGKNEILFGLPRGAAASRQPAAEKFSTTKNRRTAQAHCIIGSRGYTSNDERRVTLALLVNLLGGPAANSILNTLLREKNGLTYGVDAAYTPYVDTGVASIYFSCEHPNVARCTDLVRGELLRLQRDQLSTRRLSMAKRQFSAQLAIGMESNEGYMLGAGKSLLVHGHVDTLPDTYRKIDTITAQDICDVANEVFSDVSTLLYSGR